MRKGNLAACVAATSLLGVLSTARAVVVFGNFEGNQSDGFMSFTSSGPVPFASDTTGSTYSYTTIGATLGAIALDVSHAGFASNLAYDFKANGHLADFMANDILSFDVTAPTFATNSGYWQVYNVALNSQGGGFASVGGTSPIYNLYPPYNGQTGTVSINYDAYKALISPTTSYLQMIVTVNNGGGAPTDFYFDNFRLSAVVVPEPTSAALASLAGLGLLARRRR